MEIMPHFAFFSGRYNAVQYSIFFFKCCALCYRDEFLAELPDPRMPLAVVKQISTETEAQSTFSLLTTLSQPWNWVPTANHEFFIPEQSTEHMSVWFKVE